MNGPWYFSVTAPAPWNKSGQTKVTVRTGGAYQVYVCVGNDRHGMTENEAWALWVALGNALHATCGPAPAWADEQATPADKRQG
ncbi:hypothetical protein GCM10017673_05040 [Streptosporangium violaceochromogenes]|nr:hypothetical protein GCM10017673_05040 [Streptosporangium violaceochromogenes]